MPCDQLVPNQQLKTTTVDHFTVSIRQESPGDPAERLWLPVSPRLVCCHQRCGVTSRRDWSRDPFSSSLAGCLKMTLSPRGLPLRAALQHGSCILRTSDPGERAPGWEVQPSDNSIANVASPHFCPMLFVRGESVSPALTQERGWHRHKHQEAGLTGGHLGGC